MPCQGSKCSTLFWSPSAEKALRPYASDIVQQSQGCKKSTAAAGKKRGDEAGLSACNPLQVCTSIDLPIGHGR